MMEMTDTNGHNHALGSTASCVVHKCWNHVRRCGGHNGSLLFVELLCLVVKRGTLLDDGKPFDLQCRPRRLASSNPWAGFGTGTPLLADNFSRLVFHQIRLLQTTLRLRGFPSKDVTFCQPR